MAKLPDSHPRSRERDNNRDRGDRDRDGGRDRNKNRERERQSQRGATPGRRAGGQPQLPGWVWLVAGLAVGALVTTLLHLADRPAVTEIEVPLPAAVKAGKAASSAPKAEPRVEAEAAPVVPAPEPATRFDFYTLLPEREVIVPDQREPAQPAVPAPVAAPAPAVRPTAPAGGTAPTAPEAAPAVGTESYLLQAGSFRGAAEAERRRALIASFGLQARIETVRAGSDTWYRVHAGPFTSRDQLASARGRLSDEGIETLQIRQK